MDNLNIVMNSSLFLKASNLQIKACSMEEDFVNIRNKVGGLKLGS